LDLFQVFESSPSFHESNGAAIVYNNTGDPAATKTMIDLSLINSANAAGKVFCQPFIKVREIR
jgi:hypothetical protein